MLDVDYSEIAKQDLEEIAANITEFAGLQSAVHVINDIQHSISLLLNHPEMGLKGHLLATREIFSRGYRVVYRITQQKILIITILHCRRLYPSL